MKFINFAVVKFSLFLTLGVLFANWASLSLAYTLLLLILLFFLLFIFWFIAKRQLFQNSIFGFITYSCFFLIGCINYQIRLPEFQQRHYSHKVNEPNLLNSDQHVLHLKINEVLKSDNFHTKYIAEVLSINTKLSHGLILVNLKRDSINSFYTINDELLISSNIYWIPTPFNPHQFDYADYMKKLGVYYQIQISKRAILFSRSGRLTLRGHAERIRNNIIEKLRNSPMKPDELSIVQALVLGQRKDISKQVYSDYTAAGAIHILAVSGMHVGIVYLILLLLFKPLKQLPYGGFIQSIFIVLCLWAFAFITGLSPSVIRAVTMFSFFSFAGIINRKTNSINTLFLSYFLLILINPLWVFHVGFQLSYFAVFFILWILPIFKSLYATRNYFTNKILDIIFVSIAAQIGVIPLSLYYFHQFPGLFLISNLLVLPFLGILLGGGVSIIILAALNSLPDWLALAYNFLIHTLNTFISWVANQDAFLIQDIHFSLELVLASYCLIFTFSFLLKRISFNRLIYFLISIVLLIGVLIWEEHKNAGNQLIFFHKNRLSLIGSKLNHTLVLFCSDSTINHKDRYPIKEYRIEKNILHYREEKLPIVFSFRDKLILRLDSLGIYPETTKVDIVLLTFSPKIHLERLIDSLQPKLIIADGNNYRSYIDRWEKTCKEKKLPFHFTGKKGAYIVNY